MLDFYRDRLGFPVVEYSDQVGPHNVFIELPGMLLEIIDNDSEVNHELLGASLDRIRLTVEVPDIEVTRDVLDIDTPIPNITQQGERSFRLHDPDGLPIIFVQCKDHSVFTDKEIVRGAASNRSNQ